MPNLLTISDFAKSGLNSDLIPWDLPPSFVTDVKNIRIKQNKLSPFGGYEAWATLPVDFDPGMIMAVSGTSTTYWVVAGADAVYGFDGTTFTDISLAAGYAGITTATDWTGCLLSKVPIINNPGSYPQYWPQINVGIPILLLPWDATQTWADVSQTCNIIRSHKQYLFALGLQDAGTEIADGVRWSSPADIADVPVTWDPTDITNVAGYTKLGGGAGAIVDGLSMRDAFVIYRERGVSVFDYVGGQFVWQIRHLSSTYGALAANCVVKANGKHYFLGDGDIFVNDGNSITSLVHDRIRNRLSQTISSEYYRNSYALKSSSSDEVWFCIPESGFEFPNIAYIYNWRDDTWSIRDLPENTTGNYGPQTVSQISWATVTGAWNTISPYSWVQSQVSPLGDVVAVAVKPAGAGQSGELRVVSSTANVQGTAYDTIIERVGIPLNGLGSVTTITRLYPRMLGPGTVSIEVGSQDYPGSPVRWKPAVVFDPETDRKVDIRTTGELHCFRISSLQSNSYWELSGIDVEYTEAGLR